jgi:hypothetical protein
MTSGGFLADFWCPRAVSDLIVKIRGDLTVREDRIAREGRLVERGLEMA